VGGLQRNQRMQKNQGRRRDTDITPSRTGVRWGRDPRIALSFPACQALPSAKSGELYFPIR